MKNFNFLGIFIGLVIGSFSLCAGIDNEERPSTSIPISEVINSIPPDIKGISSVKIDNNQWVVKTVNVSKDIANQAIHPTFKFVEAKYRLNPKTLKFEQLGKPKYNNNEQLPPNYSSLKGAIGTVHKSIKNSTILSVEFDNGNWEVEVINTTGQEPKKVTKYIINPVNSVITGSSQDD